MPDETCRAAREQLRHQFNRLDDLLKQLHGSEPWPTDDLALLDLEVIIGHTKAIEASLDEIVRIVSMTKG
ncbi:hypothetical protein HCU64_20780 [Methylobacterium sp. C25]|uniref:hypothetical protein n=1 Tax=Methylobacterium sp. C25 TaxID=2721622 RepID=UPI001F20F9E8|nr:hypothetical protein [Methylobacterium sp. C25]MCE4226189.1 hypothetical protein [Methylobacterium sp. C25]